MTLAEIIRDTHYFNLSDYNGSCPCAGGLEIKGVRFLSHCWRCNGGQGVEVDYDPERDDCPPTDDIRKAGDEVARQLRDIWGMDFPVRLNDTSTAESAG